MRRFILYSRTGFTGPFNVSLREAGRLDTVYQCIVSAMFISHGIRRDTEFHAFLYGRPNPPLHLTIKGNELYDVRVDERTWNEIFNVVFSGKTHPGIYVKHEGIETYVKTLDKIFILNEKGDAIDRIQEEKLRDASFILGDHVGLPIKFEKLLERYNAEKLSLGKTRYLAASVINIINYILDKQE